MDAKIAPTAGIFGNSGKYSAKSASVLGSRRKVSESTVSAAANSDHEVARLEVIFKGFGKNVVPTNVVGNRHHAGKVVVEADHFETLIEPVGGALEKIARRVAGTCSRPAVAHGYQHDAL